MDELRALVSALPPELARRAFTHSSWTEDRAESYERLEFLGDGVLGLAVAEELCRRFPDAEEGRLPKLRAPIVSPRPCAAEGARRGAERAGLDTNRNVLAALLEAVVGAAFVAHGYERTARAVVDAFQ